MPQYAVALLVCCLSQALAFVLQRPFRIANGYESNHATVDEQRYLAASLTTSLEPICENLQETLKPVKNDLTKTCRVQVAPVTTDRLGLVATEPISRGETVLSIPYDDRYILSADLAEKTVFKGFLPDDYESWTGEKGLIALLILNEVARAAGMGIDQPPRSKEAQAFMASWVAALPGPDDLNHPLLWSEEDQEVLQSSSTSKIYRQLDDLEEDALWLEKNVFANDRNRFPETISWNNREIPCFTVQGFKWAIALSQSRSFFVDGRLRLIPLLDMCNHSDDGVEVKHGVTGTFGTTTKGVQLVASENAKVGEEVFCSYGPKSAADYILENGFCPDACWKTAISELVFEVEKNDRFYDDKVDILEFETYDQAPMDPVQAFDLVSAPGRDGEPDPAMMQFLRLCKLGGTDAFLLEGLFRKEVWGFMSLPVSEKNEREVVNAIAEACQRALDDLGQCPPGGPPVCSKLRESEAKALTRTMEFLQREKEALDLKEYYQERRLKDLGLDSEWAPEDDIDPGVSYGQKRAPGGADYDW